MSAWLFNHLFISTNIRLLNFESSQEKLKERKRSYQEQSPPQQQGKQQSPGEAPLLHGALCPPAQHTPGREVEPRLHLPWTGPGKGRERIYWEAQLAQEIRTASPAGPRAPSILWRCSFLWLIQV